MASFPLKVCKRCCVPLPSMENHDSCPPCLGIGHEIFSCKICCEQDFTFRLKRRSLLEKAKEMGAFPEDWAKQLYDIPQEKLKKKAPPKKPLSLDRRRFLNL